MKSVNKVIIIGHLGKDPEIKFTPTGKKVAKFSVATNSRFQNGQGNWTDRADWHNITAWERLADISNDYLKKGDRVYVEGRLQTRTYDKDGQKHYVTDIVALDLVMLGKPLAKADSEPDQDFDTATPVPVGAATYTNSTITDEDIPF